MADHVVNLTTSFRSKNVRELDPYYFSKFLFRTCPTSKVLATPQAKSSLLYLSPSFAKQKLLLPEG